MKIYCVEMFRAHWAWLRWWFINNVWPKAMNVLSTSLPNSFADHVFTCPIARQSHWTLSFSPSLSLFALIYSLRTSDWCAQDLGEICVLLYKTIGRKQSRVREEKDDDDVVGWCEKCEMTRSRRRIDWESHREQNMFSEQQQIWDASLWIQTPFSMWRLSYVAYDQATRPLVRCREVYLCADMTWQDTVSKFHRKKRK